MEMSEKFLDAEKVSIDQKTSDLAADKMKETVDSAKGIATIARENWISERAKDMPEVSEAVAFEALKRAIDDQVLSGPFVLTIRCPKTGSLRRHSVSEILSKSTVFDGWETLNPIDDCLSAGKVSGKLRLKGKSPYLDSFASGTHQYQLFKSADDFNVERLAIEVSRENPASTVDSCLDAFADVGRFYISGQTPFAMRNGKARHLTVNFLDYELSKLVAPYETVAKKDAIEHKPVQLAQRTINQINELLVDHLPQLSAVVDHPVLRPDGTLISRPGYDAATGIYLSNGASRFPEIVTEFDSERIKELVDICFRPFRRYVFADDVKGRTAILAAVLTAVLRPAMETAPMIAVTSPEIGVGKSFIAQALGTIATGELPKLKSVERSSSSEMRKVLFADLLEQNPVIVYDNMDGAFRNEILTSYITTPIWSDRILGESRTGGSIRNTALLITNGVNMSFPRGMSRRYLLIDLKAPCEDHITADFGFTPHGEAKLHRPDIVSAALSVAVSARPEAPYGGTLGSFETWTRLVRDPILHIIKEVPSIGLCDPLDLFVDALNNAVDDESHRTFLEKLFEKVGAADFEAHDVRTEIMGSEELRELITEISVSDPTLSTRSVAALLGKLRGLELNGVSLTSKKRAGRNLWKIEGLE